MSPSLLADTVVLLHLLYVGFVIFGFLTIPAGWALGWAWVRNRTFRLLHFAAIAFVGLEGLIGMVCPLTEWEAQLRRMAGEDFGGGAFIARLASRILYYDLPPWIFAAAYVLLTLLAAWLLWALPPMRRARKSGP
jgi:hypothetical protein